MTLVKIKKKTKQQLLTEQIDEAVGAGREVAVETVDFADPNRPKTCLEVDFPIIPINQIAIVEGNASKPIYQMSKWWARRRSSVFRSMLLAGAMKAPDDESKAAKAVWDVYYANHQKRGSLRHLSVVEPFMGGGTTLVEGSRLGMKMFGSDLNPVAWFVVKNEMQQADVGDVKRLLADVQAEVKPRIMPFYACGGPGGERGRWFQKAGTTAWDTSNAQGNLLDEAPVQEGTRTNWESLPADFDIFAQPSEVLEDYSYDGPEIIYTFWAKHGPCKREGCGHLTPIMATPVVAIKTLTVESWSDWECRSCGTLFDIERFETRIAPDSSLYVVPGERPFASMDASGQFACPRCGRTKQDERAFLEGESTDLGKPKDKKVELSLLIHPQWMAGSPKADEAGREYGGSQGDALEATIRWNDARASALRLLEVRGPLPDQVTCPDTHVTFYTDERGGTTRKTGFFTCGAPTCGLQQSTLDAIEATGKSAPWARSCAQGFSLHRKHERKPYGGRFFFAPTDATDLNAAWTVWDLQKDAGLEDYWPKSEIPFGHMTHQRNPLPRHGIGKWTDFFNPRQMFVHAQLLRAITTNSTASTETVDFVLGGFQQYLRNNNLFCIWNVGADKLEPFFANNNFNPKSNVVENCVFTGIGRGNWVSCVEGLVEGLEWTHKPYEVVSGKLLANFTSITSEKNAKAYCSDPVQAPQGLTCQSATDLQIYPDSTIDLVITDPPFGGLLHYAELSDFFYVWLRLALKDRYPNEFGAPYVPKALEAIASEARHPGEADAFYQRILTDCWRESYRILKAGGILAFTFHHSEDEPWVGVLESLFEAGFYLEATYPIRSDETKGEGEFGSKQIEYDIIHVCRKRMIEPVAISWARLRRLIVDDVRRITTLLSQHEKGGLPAADLQVIKRGKALEYFSRHYGKVYIEQGREFTIRDALVGINLILDDDANAAGGPEAPPTNAEPYTRQFFRLFYSTNKVPRDQMSKFLRGTGIAPSDFEERGWCAEKNKVFTMTNPVDLAKGWKGASRKGMARDFDQTMFLVGGCIEGSNIRIADTLDSPNFAPHPATAELVDWLTRHGSTPEIMSAAHRARTIYREWLGKNKGKEQDQLRLFDLEV